MFAALQRRRITSGLILLAVLTACATATGCGRSAGTEKIIVQGASGQLGSLVVEELLEMQVPAEKQEAARGQLGFQAELNSPYLRVVSTAVEDLTGRPPTSLRTLLEANRQRLQAAANGQ